MLNHLRYITKSTAIYSIGQIAPKLVGIILLPFFTDPKYLSAADYGKLSILESSSLLLITFFGFGLNYALERWYWDNDYINKRKSITFTLLVTIVFLTAFFWGIMSFFSKDISFLVTGDKDWGYIVTLLMICSAFESLILIPTTLLRLEEKPALFVSSNIIRFIIYLASTIFFLIFRKTGLEGIYEARLLSLISIFLILIPYIIKSSTFKIEWAALKDMLFFRLPLVLSTISYVIFNITDRFTLRVMGESSFQDVGIYNLGFTLTNSVKVIVIASIWLSVRPLIYKMMNDPTAKRFYSKLMKYMMFCISCLMLVITVFGQEVILVLSGNKIFNQSFYIIPIISIAIIFDTLKEIAQSIGLNIVKRTSVIGVMMVAITILNITINIILIPLIGIFGAATSTAISQIIFFIFIYRYSQKYYPVPYEIKKILSLVLVFSIISGLSLLTSNLSLIIRLPLKTLLLVLFPLILYYTNFFEDIELLRLKQIWKKWREPSAWAKLIT